MTTEDSKLRFFFTKEATEGEWEEEIYTEDLLGFEHPYPTKCPMEYQLVDPSEYTEGVLEYAYDTDTFDDYKFSNIIWDESNSNTYLQVLSTDDDEVLFVVEVQVEDNQVVIKKSNEANAISKINDMFDADF